jgi:hypothetical protein
MATTNTATVTDEDSVAEINLVRRFGNSFPIQFQLKKLDGTAFADITTGFSFRMSANPESTPATSGNHLWTLTGVIVDGPNAIFEFQPSSARKHRS